MANANSPTQPQRALSTLRREEALKLRLSGKSMPAIAAQLGISVGAVHKYITQALEEHHLKDEDVAELRALEIGRLDALLAAVWPAAEAGVFEAVDRALSIADRRAKLQGLDRPTKIAPTDPTGDRPFGSLSDEQLAQRLRVAVAGGSPSPGTPLALADGGEQPPEPEATGG